MDLTQDVRQFGNKWTLAVNQHFEKALEPLHAARSSQYHDTVKVKRDVKYGNHERHRVDIFTPATATASSRLPVVIYFHGGGFTSGDNTISPSIHGNIGNFFASHDCVGVLGTYRLLPDARFPDGAADVTAALTWIVENIELYGGDSSRLFPIGQSAGGAHLATALFKGLLKENDLLRCLGGIIFQSVPFWYNLNLERRRKNMILYHGTESEEEITSHTSASLLEQCKGEEIEQWPNLLFMVGEYDPDEIVKGNLMVVEVYRKLRQRMPIFEVMEGHNHISYALAIGLDGEKIGRRLLRFVHGDN